MSKAVMVSIQPYYVFLIIAKYMGWNIPQDKKVEVRKGFPQDKCWNKKVNIYCSRSKKSFNRIPKQYQPLMRPFLGKVIGEFICDYIDETYPIIFNSPDKYIYLGDWVKNKANTKNTCLSLKELSNYGKGKPLYTWHISNLKIYNKPKELSEFCIMKKCNACKSGYESNACIYDNNCKVPVPLTRPPQSWCYVEELSNEI